MARRSEALRIGALVEIAGRAATGRLAMISLVSAVSEGLGFVLLVPLLAQLSDAPAQLPLGISLDEFSPSTILAGFVVLVVIRAIAEIARRLAVQDLQVAVVDGLRLRATEALLGADWRWLSRLKRSTSEALLISNIDRASYAVDMFAALVRLSLSLLALAIAALAISPAAALTGGAAGALVLLTFLPLLRRARQLGEKLSRANDGLYARLGETLGALRVIKSYGREERAQQEIASALDDLRRQERSFVRDSALGQAALQIGGAIAAALLAWFALGALAMPLAILLPLAAIFVRALPLLGQLQASAQGWNHARPAIDEALTLIEEARKAHEPTSLDASPRLSDSIVLDQIAIAYRADRPALSGVSLKIDARQLLVLTGPSGCGKSTLADVAAGLIAPDAGTIAVDGTVLDDTSRRAWRSRIAYVQQESVLFSGTVRDNLLWADPDADEERMKRALEEASAGFVYSLPEGIDCDLGEGGLALSGGERQRIALARALMRDPDLVVLDEATSALDATSENAIAAALHAMTEKRTVIAIAHRGLLPDIADRVVRLDKGRIAGD
ncbi:ABC transporter ATP-binding protein [Qipengyuania sphaerica]|uniref:ABC transporter ATP-binding protein n=1 Tax=Qipengyuania sphaerica TaxID=2867243 RepID=UPI001C879BE5|nr:ABC transporter ATP-binding protein [Qipengyuania sphaerica]MBX7541611.1 ABC transporter ATP-binding protein/permease [Qipengyuania sphaerica]